MAVAPARLLLLLVDFLGHEKWEVSEVRAEVLKAMDMIQEELKRRYRDDPTLVLS